MEISAYYRILSDGVATTYHVFIVSICGMSQSFPKSKDTSLLRHQAPLDNILCVHSYQCYRGISIIFLLHCCRVMS
jgi:hypothetical protein